MIRRIETEKVKLKMKEYKGKKDLFNRHKYKYSHAMRECQRYLQFIYKKNIRKWTLTSRTITKFERTYGSLSWK